MESPLLRRYMLCVIGGGSFEAREASFASLIFSELSVNLCAGTPSSSTPSFNLEALVSSARGSPPCPPWLAVGPKPGTTASPAPSPSRRELENSDDPPTDQDNWTLNNYNLKWTARNLFVYLHACTTYHYILRALHAPVSLSLYAALLAAFSCS